MVCVEELTRRKMSTKDTKGCIKGFLLLRSVSSESSHSLNCEFYNGVELDVNYKFPNNRLDDYEDRVSTELNKCLRRHTGVEMTKPKLGLKCDDMGWVDINEYQRRPQVRAYLAP